MAVKTNDTPKTLAEAIAKASLDVGGKLEADKRNKDQNYDYMSADLILNRVGQALAKVGIACLPMITSADVIAAEYQSYGKTKTRITATVNFVFDLCYGDEKATLPWIGMGVDYVSNDKALYKAITSGHKYFLMKLCNVGQGNEDGEHESEPLQKATVKVKNTAHLEETAKELFEEDKPPVLGDEEFAPLRKRFHAVGTNKYGKEWDAKRAAFCEFYNVKSSNDIDIQTVNILIEGMEKQVKEKA